MENNHNVPSGADDEKKAILNAHEEVIVRSIKSNLEAARALAAIYQGSLWRFADTSYEGFNVYCEERLHLSRIHAFRLRLFGMFLEEEKIPEGQEPAEAHVRPMLKKCLSENRHAIYVKACELAQKDGASVPDAKHIRAAIESVSPSKAERIDDGPESPEGREKEPLSEFLQDKGFEKKTTTVANLFRLLHKSPSQKVFEKEEQALIKAFAEKLLAHELESVFQTATTPPSEGSADQQHPLTVSGSTDESEGEQHEKQLQIGEK